MPKDYPEVFSIVSFRLNSGDYLYGNGRLQLMVGATDLPIYRGTFEMRGPDVPLYVDLTREVLIDGYRVRLWAIVKQSELDYAPLRLTLTLESTGEPEL